MEETVEWVVESDCPFYARIPEKLLFDPTIGPRAKAAYAILDRHACPNPVCFAGRPRLAKFLGCSLDSVDRALNQLRHRGWISSNYDQKTHRLYFRLHWTPRGLKQGGSRTGAAGGSRTGAAQNESPLNESPTTTAAAGVEPETSKLTTLLDKMKIRGDLRETAYEDPDLALACAEKAVRVARSNPAGYFRRLLEAGDWPEPEAQPERSNVLPKDPVKAIRTKIANGVITDHLFLEAEIRGFKVSEVAADQLREELAAAAV